MDASLRLEINAWSLIVVLLADLYAGKVKLHGSDVAGWVNEYRVRLQWKGL